ncbi:arylesterase [Gilvimarinus agarilyticus]|uniref:arylesterase n=1 Tax=Gilvimarinus agarilyticus TaxID=679259 RepID=UPI0005A0682D|nr:arylesterase [Gilvimarinus agarilyticus]
MRSPVYYRFYQAVLALALLTLSAVYAQAKPATIVVLGDSLSAGYGMALKQGWVQLLRERLAQQDNTSRYQVINASVSGETTQGGLSRLDALLKTHQPEIIIVELGGNDGLRGQPIKLMRQNLTDIIKKAQAASATVLLVGMQIPPNYGARYTQLFAKVYPELAEQLNVPLVPFLLEGIALEPELMQKDGIHANMGAQATLLDNVWPFLQPLL